MEDEKEIYFEADERQSKKAVSGSKTYSRGS